MQPEAKLTRRIRQDLKSNFGGWWVKLHGGPFQAAGLPDILGLCDSKFFGIEVKMPGKENTVSEIQAYTLKKIRENGGIGIVVTSVLQAREEVREALK